MKKTPIIVGAVVLILVAAIFGYRAYRDGADRDLLAQREADERTAGEQHKLDADRRVAAEVEARRLAEAKAQQEASEADKLRSDEAAAEVARKVAVEELARTAAERDRLRVQKEAAEADSRRLAEARERDATEAEKARNDALAKLAAIEQEKHDADEREIARLAALTRQQQVEAAQPSGSKRNRSIYPNDYKRRAHYLMDVDLFNTNFVRPFVKPMATR